VSPSGPSELTCPSCGIAIEATDQYCEGCGRMLSDAGGATAGPAALTSPAPCRSCGAVVTTGGRCGDCDAPMRDEHDHWVEEPASWVAGVCDRGRRHARNEDALATAVDEASGVAVAVVCDGVSSAPRSDAAALAAVRAARDVLRAPVGFAEVTDRSQRWRDTVVRAAAVAQDAAAAVATAATTGGATNRGNPPSCTFIATVVDGPLVVAGGIGDSRAYWLPDGGGGTQLGIDDSLAAEAMALGVGRAEAETGPHAHALTRWLGLDSPDPVPSLATIEVAGPGWVLVCTDGLWNYCSEAEELGALVARLAAGVGVVSAGVAGALVDWANEQGGHDNIAVVVIRLDVA
jgi:serine/threonine protein phosphatase PrpC